MNKLTADLEQAAHLPLALASEIRDWMTEEKTFDLDLKIETNAGYFVITAEEALVYVTEEYANQVANDMYGD